jgi:hypothetical protein
MQRCHALVHSHFRDCATRKESQSHSSVMEALRDATTLIAVDEAERGVLISPKRVPHIPQMQHTLACSLHCLERTDRTIGISRLRRDSSKEARKAHRSRCHVAINSRITKDQANGHMSIVHESVTVHASLSLCF